MGVLDHHSNGYILSSAVAKQNERATAVLRRINESKLNSNKPPVTGKFPRVPLELKKSPSRCSDLSGYDRLLSALQSGAMPPDQALTDVQIEHIDDHQSDNESEEHVPQAASGLGNGDRRRMPRVVPVQERLANRLEDFKNFENGDNFVSLQSIIIQWLQLELQLLHSGW